MRLVVDIAAEVRQVRPDAALRRPVVDPQYARPGDAEAASVASYEPEIRREPAGFLNGLRQRQVGVEADTRRIAVVEARDLLRQVGPPCRQNRCPACFANHAGATEA